MAPDKSVVKRDAATLSKPHGSRGTGIRYRNNDVSINSRLLSQFHTHLLPYTINTLTIYITVRTGKVDMLKNTKRLIYFSVSISIEYAPLTFFSAPIILSRIVFSLESAIR